ncbi:hypothetical protein LRO89_08795 [Priestia megaterium]|uniref:BsuBI/PstI family type II restriction endonuclease n=1 Tax=Priestia megaterium TaxID=1404 RepID=UPI0039C01643
MKRVEQIIDLMKLRNYTTEKNHERCIKCVETLLNDQIPSPYKDKGMSDIYEEPKFCHGANTASIASVIQQLEGKTNKLDREGRDHWIKPLLELGVLRKGYLKPPTNKNEKYRIIKDYHYTKSQNNFYFVSEEFKALLNFPEEDLKEAVSNFLLNSSKGKELRAYQIVSENINSHSQLINQAVEFFTKKHIPDFKVIYIDDEDGTRIREEFSILLEKAGITLDLSSRYPDAILWNEEKDLFWLLDAVESDGEFDHLRVEDLYKDFVSSGKVIAGFTTIYRTWNKVANRQGIYKNLSPGTSFWIANDPGKVFYVSELIK